MDLSVVCITELDGPHVLKAYVKMSLSSTLKESVLVLSGEMVTDFSRDSVNDSTFSCQEIC